MSNLWITASRHLAMPWYELPGEEGLHTPRSVRDAGFAGYVGDHPEHHEGHDDPADVPDHYDPRLFHFIDHHSNDIPLWHDKGRLGMVDISHPIHATQSHVADEHIAKYHRAPDSFVHESRPEWEEYPGQQAPMIVRHEGRLHAIEGHHRLAAALMRGDKKAPAWYFDLDSHYMPGYDGADEHA